MFWTDWDDNLVGILYVPDVKTHFFVLLLVFVKKVMKPHLSNEFYFFKFRMKITMCTKRHIWSFLFLNFKIYVFSVIFLVFGHMFRVL